MFQTEKTPRLPGVEESSIAQVTPLGEPEPPELAKPDGSGNRLGDELWVCDTWIYIAHNCMISCFFILFIYFLNIRRYTKVI